MKLVLVLLSLFVLSGFTMSCASTEPAPAAENTMCVMNPDEAADPSVTTEFEGHTVAFCCANCRKKFDGMTRGQQVAKLQAAGIAVN